MKTQITKLYYFLKDFITDLNHKNVSTFAAGAAFFLFVSLIPTLYILCAIVSITNITESELLKAVRIVAPNVIGDFFITLISDVYSSSIKAVSLAIAVTIWLAGKGMLALMRGLNVMNEVKEHRNYFLIRFIAGIYTVILLSAVVISLVFLRVVMKYRFVLWLILTLFFALIYAYVPNKKTGVGKQLPGALLSAVSWTFFSWGFSLYIKCFGGFEGYGSLTTIVVVLIWMYFSMYILLIGAKINNIG
ncbi:MAG: YihY/virulence factor BrkB family protein [Lachnospiraceae bacterium]|nr:YihY/virulence factor BrkB family protein [Lachnospiraceae bacterium]